MIVSLNTTPGFHGAWILPLWLVFASRALTTHLQAHWEPEPKKRKKRKKKKPPFCRLAWKALKLWFSALLFFFSSCLCRCWGADRFSSQKAWLSYMECKNRSVCAPYTDVSFCRKPPRAELRHMNGMCVLFCCEGPICIHMNISIYIFFKAFLYVSKLLFNVCVPWKTLVLYVCITSLQYERHNVVYHVISPAPPSHIHSSFFQ